MAHDVSLTSSRFDHMSPTGVALATLLHAAVALALWWVSPLRHVDQSPKPIEITMEREVQPPPPAPPPPPPQPPPERAAAPPPPPPPPPPVQQAAPPSMGLRPPIGTTMDSRAPLTAPKTGAAEPAGPAGQEPAKAQSPKEAAQPQPPKEIVKVEPQKEKEVAKSEPTEEQHEPEPAEQQQQAALAPPPPQPPVPTLEKALPPLEAPPPPLTSREIPRPAPPPPPPPPPKVAPHPAPRAQTPPHQQLPPSPLSRPGPQQHAPAESQQAARPAPSPLVNPAAAYGERKTEEDYLWQVVRKISQYRFYPRSSREQSEEGLVIVQLTIARDGRLLGATLSKSSGYPTLDNAVLETIRQAAPYAPLPSGITGDRHTFILPVNYRRHDQP